jgi:aryl-alcohol dehydrogenase-like predicted oxidoreductase
VTQIEGFATPEGTARLAAHFPSVAQGHYRAAAELTVSSVGIGTYLGRADGPTDTAYAASVARAVELGANVVDTAINYRFQRGERAVGAALRALAQGGVARDEVVLCTKGGFIPFDGSYPANPVAWVSDTLIAPGVICAEDIVGGCHCMTPTYLRHQVACSLANLGVSAVDVYYLHNPESQLDAVPREEFGARLERAFEALEAEAAAGRIRNYGAATWNGFRVRPGDPSHLSLEDMVAAARRAGGEGHHFRFIQLPLNLAMAEAVELPTQKVGGELVTALEAAAYLGLTVVASASILQGQLIGRLPSQLAAHFPGIATDAGRAIQFARSAPGIATALVGMARVAHVEENLRLASVAPLGLEEFDSLR